MSDKMPAYNERFDASGGVARLKVDMNKCIECGLIFIIFIIIMSSCSIFVRMGQISIKKMEKDIVPFSSLPAEIKEFFYDKKNIPKQKRWDFSSTRLFTFNTDLEYEFKYVETKIGPWISHYLLIDKTNDITYRIDFGNPLPIFVFDREIFIPTDCNVLSESEEKFETLTFSRYLIDSLSRGSKRIR